MKYYDISNDIKNYKAWLYMAIGGRSTGKTYGALLMALKEKKKFVFVKRTIDDVKLLCGRGKLSEFEVDLSPFKPINRDHGTNIKARIISDKGIGGFWRFSDDEPQGDPIGYILALSAVQKFKGFDLSECDYIIFDEFIPQPWERVNRKEGEQVLDLYKTVARDRETRGREPLKLLCLANAVNISNPLSNILELTDIIADMEARDEEIYFNRGMFVRRIVQQEIAEAEQNTMLYEAMHDTQWGHMAYDNNFAYDDLSNIGKVNIKGYHCYYRIKYKNKYWYLWGKNGQYYFSYSASDHYHKEYNLNRENDQKLFNIEKRIDIAEKCTRGKVTFESYTMYDIIMNYVKYFRL